MMLMASNMITPQVIHITCMGFKTPIEDSACCFCSLSCLSNLKIAMKRIDQTLNKYIENPIINL